MKRTLLATLAIGAVAAVPVAADAQEAQDASTIEDIVVTAQKREERLQDVPISVTAVTADALSESGIRTTQDLATAVGGLNVNRTTAATVFTLRGIGTQGGSTGQDSAVATFVDGVYMPSMAGATFALNNIERIEVLKGPQGTLYGRNATGGAVNVITLTPDEEFFGAASIGYGNYDTVEGNLYITGGLAPGIAADLAVYYRDQGEGFGVNRIIGSEVNASSDFMIRSKLYGEFGADTRITLAADWGQTEGSWAMAYRPVPTSQLLDGTGYAQFQAAGNGFYDSQSDFQPATSVDTFGGSLRVEHDFSDSVSITNILAFRGQDGYQRVEVDATPLKIIDAPLFDQEGQWTNETQISYSGDRLNAIAGVYYMDAESQYSPFQIAGLAIVAQTGGASDRLVMFSTQETTSTAVFGQATWEFLPDTNLTVGARYTEDERSLHADQFLLIGGALPGPFGDNTYPSSGVLAPIGTVDQSRSFSRATWRIGIDHHFTPDLMVYANYSTGFKSGVFNLTSPADAPAAPESLSAYEIGFKSTIADRVRFNAAAFVYDYQNIQAFQVNGANTTLTNAASAEVYGIDFDLQAELAAGFSLTASGAWVSGEYGDFPIATISFLSQPVGAPNYAGYTPGLGNYVFPDCGNPIHTGQFYCSATGNNLVNTPEYNFNLGLNHEMAFAGGELNSSLSFTYNGGYYFAVDNRVEQDAYTLVNAQLVWTAPNDRFNIRGWVRNLTEEEYFLSFNENGSGDIASPAPGRTYGVSVGFQF